MPDSIAPEPSSPATALEWGMFYVARGWSVVPVRRGEKLPAIPWAKYQSLPANSMIVRAWLDSESFMGLGLVQGRHVGTMVLDFDGEAGMATLADLEARGLPVSPRQFTPRGGVHVVLRHPGPHVPTRKNVLPGMDVRGDGGFIVAAPSLGANGRPYAWDADAHPEDVAIADCPIWLAEIVCGPVDEGAATGQVIRAPIKPAGAFGLPSEDEIVTDGRETYMRDTLMAVMRDLRDRLGRMPTDAELIEAAWPQYSAKVDFSRPGRGPQEFAAKARYTLSRARAGHIKGFDPGPAFDPETGEIFGDKPDFGSAEPDEPGEDECEPDPEPKAQTRPRPDRALRLMSIAEVEAMPPPEWLIEGLIPEQGLVMPYGPPGAGKTFIVLSQALHIAAGREWFGRKVKQGAVVYVVGEGLGGFSTRLKAMRQHHGFPADLPFFMVPRAVNFKDGKELTELVRLVREAVPPGITIAMVVVDTLARAMPGVDENSAQETGVIIAMCDELRHELGCSVAPIHHTGKDVERGLRGSNALLGAVDATFLIQAAGAGYAKLTTEKQKDGEPAKPMIFRMEEVSTGFRSSLVPVLEESRGPGRPKDPDAPSDEELLKRVVVAMGRARELPFARVVEAIGLGRGRAAGMLAELIPIGREYAIKVQRGSQHSLLWRRIAGEHRTAPIFIHTEASDDAE